MLSNPVRLQISGRTAMDQECNTGVVLGMGVGVTVIKEEENCFRRRNEPPVQLDLLPLGPMLRDGSPPRESLFAPASFPLLKNSYGSHDLSTGHCDGADAGDTRSSRHVTVSGREIDVNKLPAACYCDDDTIASSPNSTVSSLKMDANCINQENTYAISVKRERNNSNSNNINIVSDEYELDRACSRASDEEEEGAGTRKKLRLSKEQSALLEESFKEHSTLNPKQKQALARQLNLRPRQVEVWFQNRRARTKLKQTEVDCEFLKRCCETLTDENRRLHKELQELRALKMASPFYMQLPAATLTMCPACERVVTADNNRTFALAKPTQFHPYTHSSAAC